MEGHQEAQGTEGFLCEDGLRTLSMFSLEKAKFRGLTQDLPALRRRLASRGNAVLLSGA